MVFVGFGRLAGCGLLLGGVWWLSSAVLRVVVVVVVMLWCGYVGEVGVNEGWDGVLTVVF